MSLWQIITKEIRHRKLSFALGVVAIWAAVGCLVGELTLLRLHDLNTQRILQEKMAETEAEMVKLEDDYRKITKKLGFNVLILPADQKLTDFHVEGVVTKYMPNRYVDQLAHAKNLTIRHLLPTLQEKILWPERNLRIILAGTRGEVTQVSGPRREPMMIAVPPGTMVVGFDIWRTLNLAPGDKVQLMGETFQISRCHKQRGNTDDGTVWIDLEQAQRLLKKPNEINAILALKCHCLGGSIDSIREQVRAILPDTQVIEFTEKVIPRAEARNRAKTAAITAMQAEKKHRDQMRQEKEATAAWLIPMVLIGAIVWIAILTLNNVRERTSEIGILCAIGLKSERILFVFLMRAALMGAIGALGGLVTALVVMTFSGEAQLGLTGTVKLFSGPSMLLTLLFAPLIAVLAGWVPSLWAARQDPAAVLREE